MSLQKSPRYESKKLLQSAKGRPCQNCGCENETTVAAHANWYEYGKGRGLKSHDWAIAWLCYDCHTWLDGGVALLLDPTKRYLSYDAHKMWNTAHVKTLTILFNEGVLKVA